ncbi:hypothetical protein DPMN_187658 [Dreissena polymorpha]|uniref:Uncharacterized protein n=1 Tax=Dreissena polymorpha TaxID=45954 RepID=A0A9D4DPX0_DREPO|nr:hypothetical protein DPMN_187658 [Dreissena polymorpha]
MLLCSHVFAGSIFSNGRYPGENDSFVETLLEDFGRQCPFTDPGLYSPNNS